MRARALLVAARPRARAGTYGAARCTAGYGIPAMSVAAAAPPFLLAALGCLVVASPLLAGALDNGVARTPPMGWVCSPLRACLCCCATTLTV